MPAADERLPWDPFWLRSLATATAKPEAWEPERPEQVRAHIVQRRDELVPELQRLLSGACELHNRHVTAGREVNLLPLQDTDIGKAGLILMQGRCQMRVVQRQEVVEVEGSTWHRYQRQVFGSWTFRMAADPLGQVLWQRAEAPACGADELARFLLTELTTAYRTWTR